MMTTLQGRIQVAVRQGDQIIKRYPWQPNLILDQGLDKIATMPFNQVFAACCCGTGSNPTWRDPATTATVSGTSLVATVPTFSTADLDGDCVFGTLHQRFKIEQYIDPQHVTLFQPGSILTPTPFTIEYTNQAILAGESKRTTVYLTTPGACGYLINPGSIVLWRTFLFSPELTEVTYTEVGVSDSSVAGPNLFSRIVLATPISLIGPQAALPQGQQFQVTYELTIGIDYGKGPGIFFPGGNEVMINVANLPIQFPIWSYANSTTIPGKLAVSMKGTVLTVIGGDGRINNSSSAAYDGVWKVLDTNQITDPVQGPSTVITLNVIWSGAATGGTFTVPLTGDFYRANTGIYLINPIGAQISPPNTADFFLGLGEPSVAGSAWLSSVSATGGNGSPSPIDSTLYDDVDCVLQPYAAGTFYLDRLGDIVIATQSSVTSFGFGVPDQTNQIETFVWDWPHALTIGATLGLTFRVSWGRTPQ